MSIFLLFYVKFFLGRYLPFVSEDSIFLIEGPLVSIEGIGPINIGSGLED